MQGQQVLKDMDALLNATDEEGNLITGKLANVELTLKSLANAIGADYKDVGQTQAFQALAAKRVAEVIKAFGAGTGLSDADREYAQMAAGGNITMDREAIQKIVDMAREAIPKRIQMYKKDVERSFGEEDPWFVKSLMVDENDLMGPADAGSINPPANAQPAGGVRVIRFDSSGNIIK